MITDRNLGHDLGQGHGLLQNNWIMMSEIIQGQGHAQGQEAQKTVVTVKYNRKLNKLNIKLTIFDYIQ